MKLDLFSPVSFCSGKKSNDSTSDDRILEQLGGGFKSPAGAVAGALGIGGKVISDAVQGNAPTPPWIPFGQTLTGTAKGPTPNNLGGRYPVSEIGKPRVMSNAPGLMGTLGGLGK